MFSVLEGERVTTLLHALWKRMLKLWQWPVVLGGSTLCTHIQRFIHLFATHTEKLSTSPDSLLRDGDDLISTCLSQMRLEDARLWKATEVTGILNSYLCTMPKRKGKKSFIRKVIAQHHSMTASPTPIPLSLWKQEVVQLLLEGLRPYRLVLLGRVMVCVSVFMGRGLERENAKIYSAKGCKWTKCSNYEEGFMFACL